VLQIETGWMWVPCMQDPAQYHCWERVHHPESDSHFYYNLFTGEVVWEDPRITYGRLLAEATKACYEYQVIRDHGDYTEMREKSTFHRMYVNNQTGEMWEVHRDDAKRTFYYNPDTQSTLWRLPGRELFNPLNKFEVENAPSSQRYVCYECAFCGVRICLCFE
jgi:hypothetical protein